MANAFFASKVRRDLSADAGGNDLLPRSAPVDI